MALLTLFLIITVCHARTVNYECWLKRIAENDGRTINPKFVRVNAVYRPFYRGMKSTIIADSLTFTQ
ncbi:MAG: hypothetical protein ICV85_16435 [Tolypothrix sp. T3-bin4]|nr:hypothetical protein [Tolypothrix sp. T3-bin4]